MVLLLLVIAVAVAQEPQPFDWWDRPMARALNLSPEQEKQVRATQREFRDKLLDQRTAVQKAEANLRDLMDEDQVNEARTREAIDRVVAARGDLMRSVSQMALEMRMVLTPQQWERVRRRTGQMLQQRRQQRLGAGPAGPAQPAQPAPAKPRRLGQPPAPVY
jgi:Spy/CpxP family protein refolding chaperone